MIDLTKDFPKVNTNNLDIYYQDLTNVNKVMNLTSITDYEEVYIKHFYDSLLLTKCHSDFDHLLDVGSGAGFPGLVLSIYNPNWHITLLEPTKKRCNFLNSEVTKFNLTNTVVLNQRAEDLKEKYQYVTARAVAQLNILLELVAPLLEINGLFFALKGQNYEAELFEATAALKTLGLVVDQIHHFTLPQDLGERVIIVFKKIKETPSIYPRRFSVIKNKPL